MASSYYYYVTVSQLLSCLWMVTYCSVLHHYYISLSFIHSYHFYSAPSSPLLLRGAPDYSTDTVSELHAEAHRQLQVKDLPKVAARARVEPATLRLKVIVSTNAPPRPIVKFTV